MERWDVEGVCCFVSRVRFHIEFKKHCTNEKISAPPPPSTHHQSTSRTFFLRRRSCSRNCAFFVPLLLHMLLFVAPPVLSTAPRAWLLLLLSGTAIWDGASRDGDLQLPIRPVRVSVMGPRAGPCSVELGRFGTSPMSSVLILYAPGPASVATCTCDGWPTPKVDSGLPSTPRHRGPFHAAYSLARKIISAMRGRAGVLLSDGFVAAREMTLVGASLFAASSQPPALPPC